MKKLMKQIFRSLHIVSGLLIFLAQPLIAQQAYNENRLYTVSGVPIHIVPEQVVRPALDTLMSLPVSSPFTSPLPAQKYKYMVQVGTFAIKENASWLEHRLKKDGFIVNVREYYSKKNLIFHVVSVGYYLNAEEAQQKLKAIRLSYNLEGLVLVQEQG